MISLNLINFTGLQQSFLNLANIVSEIGNTKNPLAERERMLSSLVHNLEQINSFLKGV